MSHPVCFLEDLGRSISQGLSISRYRKKGGKAEPIVNVKDLSNLYVGNALEYVELKIDEKIQKYRLIENDVIISIRGSLLKASVIDAASRGSIAGQNVAIFRPKNIEETMPEYIAVLMRSKWIKNSSKITQGKGSVLPSLRISDLRKIKVPLLEIDLQQRIVDLYMKFDSYQKVVAEELELRAAITEEAISIILEN